MRRLNSVCRRYNTGLEDPQAKKKNDSLRLYIPNLQGKPKIVIPIVNVIFSLCDFD